VHKQWDRASLPAIDTVDDKAAAGTPAPLLLVIKPKKRSWVRRHHQDCNCDATEGLALNLFFPFKWLWKARQSMSDVMLEAQQNPHPSLSHN
jgi:hypothetical protein